MNVTQLSACWDFLSELDWDVLLLQETRLVEGSNVWSTFTAHCDRKGWTFIRGLTKDGVCLVGAVVRYGAVRVRDTLVGDPARSLVFDWFIEADVPIMVGCIDCKLGHQRAVVRETSAMVEGFLEIAETRGAIPALLAGDFNQELNRLDCLARLAVCGWVDLGEGGTCNAGASRRRIDLLLASPALAARAGLAGLDWSTGMRTHAYQWVEFADGRPGQVPR